MKAEKHDTKKNTEKQSNEHVEYFQVFRVPETATVLLR